MKKVRDGLEERVKERTAELRESEEALRRAGASTGASSRQVSTPRHHRPRGAHQRRERGDRTGHGLCADELIGTDFSDYFTDPEKARAGYRMVFDEGRSATIPSRSATGTGASPQFSTTPPSTGTPTGSVIGVFAAARDVSEHKSSRPSSARRRRWRPSDAVRRHRPRLQQHARRHHRLYRADQGPHPEGSREHRHAQESSTPASGDANSSGRC